MKKAVFSFFPYHTSGNTFSWWDGFPKRIGMHLERKGITHIPFYRDYADASEYPDFQRHTATKEQIRSPIWAWQNLRQYAREFDKVVFHAHKCSLFNGLWVFNNNFNRSFHCIATDHNMWPSVKISKLKSRIRQLLRSFGLLPEIILGCSKASKRRLKNIYGCKNVSYIYNGTDIPEVRPPKPLESPPNKALFVGRLEDYKGLWPLVKAFELMKGDASATLSIAGTGSLYKPLLEYIAKNGLEKRIKLVGHLSNITKIMLDSHFIIIPTIYEENCPVTSLEAQAHYLPCIYTNSGGLPETQINHKTGIMVSKNRPLEIVDAIKYLQSDLDRFNKMCLDARENSLNFTMDKMAKNYSDLYLGLFEK